jgi:hypothetical protein
VIVELIVGAGLVVAGAAAARVLLRRQELDEEADGERNDERDDEGASTDGTGSDRSGAASFLEGGPRGLRVGDVLLYADTELWLAGMIHLDEEGFVLRLFPTPGGLRADWVAQLDEQGQDVATLQETDEVPAGRVPEALPIGGRRLTLERRGQAEVHTDGEHLPRTTARASYDLLSDAGGRVLVVVDFDKAPRLALVGDRVGEHLLDLLPGGDLQE